MHAGYQTAEKRNQKVYDPELARVQCQMGCDKCDLADRDYLGFGCACKKGGWRPSLGTLHCKNQSTTLQSDKL
jgi:hypothetical protein